MIHKMFISMSNTADPGQEQSYLGVHCLATYFSGNLCLKLKNIYCQPVIVQPLFLNYFCFVLY